MGRSQHIIGLLLLASSAFLILPASALSYDEIVLLVQAEQRVFGKADNSHPFDERLKALETSTFGHESSGSESKRIKAICAKLGMIPAEAVAPLPVQKKVQEKKSVPEKTAQELHEEELKKAEQKKIAEQKKAELKKAAEEKKAAEQKQFAEQKEAQEARQAELKAAAQEQKRQADEKKIAQQKLAEQKKQSQKISSTNTTANLKPGNVNPVNSLATTQQAQQQTQEAAVPAQGLAGIFLTVVVGILALGVGFVIYMFTKAGGNDAQKRIDELDDEPVHHFPRRANSENQRPELLRSHVSPPGKNRTDSDRFTPAQTPPAPEPETDPLPVQTAPVASVQQAMAPRPAQPSPQISAPDPALQAPTQKPAHPATAAPLPQVPPQQPAPPVQAAPASQAPPQKPVPPAQVAQAPQSPPQKPVPPAQVAQTPQSPPQRPVPPALAAQSPQSPPQKPVLPAQLASAPQPPPQKPVHPAQTASAQQAPPQKPAPPAQAAPAPQAPPQKPATPAQAAPPTPETADQQAIPPAQSSDSPQTPAKKPFPLTQTQAPCAPQPQMQEPEPAARPAPVLQRHAQHAPSAEHAATPQQAHGQNPTPQFLSPKIDDLLTPPPEPHHQAILQQAPPATPASTGTFNMISKVILQQAAEQAIPEPTPNPNPASNPNPAAPVLRSHVSPPAENGMPKAAAIPNSLHSYMKQAPKKAAPKAPTDPGATNEEGEEEATPAIIKSVEDFRQEQLSKPLQFKLCPECDASYSLEAKFCINDGEALQVTEMDPAVAFAFGERYEIQSVIASGGMSVLYQARHKMLNKEVAIKVMDPRLVRNSSLVKRFQREAQMICRMNHPNVIVVHDFGTTNNGQPYIVMDFLGGRTLCNLLDEVTQLPWHRAKNIFLQVASGLGHAHQLGVVHRDVKPTNIIVDVNEFGGDQVTIVDFGIAKMGAETKSTREKLTQFGELFGTTMYMSPEQCRGQDVDARTDIYSLGCVMFEVLCGLPPFNTGDDFEMRQMIVSVTPPSLAERRPDIYIPLECEAVLKKALEKDRELRYQSMDDLMVDISKIPS